MRRQNQADHRLRAEDVVDLDDGLQPVNGLLAGGLGSGCELPRRLPLGRRARESAQSRQRRTAGFLDRSIARVNAGMRELYKQKQWIINMVQ